MVRAILGRKVGMTQIFEELPERDAQGNPVKDEAGNPVLRRTGRVLPVTVVEAGPCIVTQKKDLQRDGYEAVQLGYGAVKESKLNKPERGHLAKHNLPARRHLQEFRVAGVGEASVGDEIKVDVFRAGQLVDVIGTSKGKGFQGVVKRYHWHGADMTHGSMIHRKPQSAGATDAARIFKGVGRPGHMGHERVTVRRLRVVRVDPERNVLLIQGAVPGPNGGLLTIREAK
jgi:large subunit ribosomal protein L3